MQEHSLFFTPSPEFIVCRPFDDGHSDRSEVISHYSFNLHFSKNELCWASFHVLLAICMSSLEKYLLKSFFHFLIGFLGFLVLSCMNFLYVLEINPVSCFICYYFLPFWGLSFHLTYTFLCCEKAFKFNQVTLVYFGFYFYYSRRWVVWDLTYDLCHRVFCLCFPQRV